MTLHKIIIKNFRQISKAEIEIRDLLFLIGEQASGKSTIAKLIYFFKSLRQDYYELLINAQTSSVAEWKKNFIKHIQNKFSIYFGYTTSLSENFEVRYYYSVNDNHFFCLSKKSHLSLTFSDDFWSFIEDSTKKSLRRVKQVNSQLETSSFKIQEQLKADLRQEIKLTVCTLFHDERDTIFFPAGRNITVSYPNQFQLLFFGAMDAPSNAIESNTIDLRLMKEFISYSKYLTDYFSENRHNISPDSPFLKFIANSLDTLLHGKYRNFQGQEQILYDTNKYVPLSNSSSGQQEVIRILQDILYTLNQGTATARIIEEPETHLYPSAQKSLIELMVLAANKTGSQVILTTHSPYVMATFNNLLYYNKLSVSPDVDSDKKREADNILGVEGFMKNMNENIAIQPSKFQAYALKPDADEYCKSIFDEDIEMIGQNYIDEASQEISEIFDNFYSMM